MSTENVDTTVAAPVAVAPAAERTIEQIAEAFVVQAPEFKIRKTNSKTFRCMTLIEDEVINWKKGLVYLAARYSKGVNLEMWAYSPKGGDHLAQFNAEIQALAVAPIKSDSLGKAVKLRIQLPDVVSDLETAQAIASFITAVEPTIAAIRAKVVVALPKKVTKAAAKVEAPAVPETPATEPTAGTEPAAEAPVLSKRQQKKAAKKAAAVVAE